MDSKYQIYLHILKQTIFRYLGLGRINRTQSRVKQEYAGAWKRSVASLSGDNYKRYKLEPAFFNGKPVRWASVDRKRYYLGEISKEINKSGAKKIIEIGSGNGFNLLALSVLNPEVTSWTGIELTAEGVMISKNFLAAPPLNALSVATGFDEDIILRRIRDSKIEYIQGDVLNSPFGDNSFDFAFTLLVIEQIPHLYEKALAEVYRIVRGRAVFIEAFHEVQKNIFQRMHLVNVDHFRSGFNEVKKAGFSILRAEPLLLDEIKFRLGILVCEKK